MTAQYINFARKYRPTSFLNVVGQEIVTKTLSHAMINGRLYQGYLFVGIRGVGKTTLARIIAKTVNCSNKQNNTDLVLPCDDCSNCVSFKKNNHPDIIEIDAASRTSVDDIRNIIEQVEYKPVIGLYTVFIIDEVHMLSKGAFNALLKVLEEPPSHVIFILATTEVQKIPLTIISRCQRFDLRRLSLKESCDLLKKIAQSENIDITDSAIYTIASRCDGSARDAISVLDQAVCFRKNDKIEEKSISKILGLVSSSTVVDFVKFIVLKEVKNALDLVNDLHTSSVNFIMFITSIVDLLCYLNKVKILPDYSNDFYSAFDNEINIILDNITTYHLSIIWQIYSNGISEVKKSHNELIDMEMLIIKSIYSQSFPSIQEGSYTVEGDDILSQIIDFLDFLYSKNEIEIYHFFMNNVEILSFTDTNLRIAIDDSNFVFEQVRALLFQWSGREYKIISSKYNTIKSIKSELLKRVKISKEWSLLMKYFPQANISDIVLKK